LPEPRGSPIPAGGSVFKLRIIHSFFFLSNPTAPRPSCPTACGPAPLGRRRKGMRGTGLVSIRSLPTPSRRS
jgi:hypothetical protein